MSRERDSQAPRIVLIVIGITFIAGIWLLMRVWPSGWQWQPSQPEYEQMILGVYATLGVFLILAAQDREKNRSLILFAAYSSFVHSGIMALQAIRDPAERGHLIGDVPALILIGFVLLAVAPKASRLPGQG